MKFIYLSIVKKKKKKQINNDGLQKTPTEKFHFIQMTMKRSSNGKPVNFIRYGLFLTWKFPLNDQIDALCA